MSKGLNPDLHQKDITKVLLYEDDQHQYEITDFLYI